jgi:hypothetical protein
MQTQSLGTYRLGSAFLSYFKSSFPAPASDLAGEQHLGAWWEGEDIDVESGLSHIIKAIASSRRLPV